MDLVLVMMRDPAERSVVVSALEEDGIGALEATDFEEAVSRLRCEVRAVLLDCTLTPDALRALRRGMHGRGEGRARALIVLRPAATENTLRAFRWKAALQDEAIVDADLLLHQPVRTYDLVRAVRLCLAASPAAARRAVGAYEPATHE